MKREIVNDAQLYGIGVKRMKEKQRVHLKPADKPNQIEHYIDCCVFINFGKNFKYLLALFENSQGGYTEAKIFDAKTYKIEDELTFPSKYAQAKPMRPQTQPKVIPP